MAGRVQIGRKRGWKPWVEPLRPLRTLICLLNVSVCEVGLGCQSCGKDDIQQAHARILLREPPCACEVEQASRAMHCHLGMHAPRALGIFAA